MAPSRCSTEIRDCNLKQKSGRNGAARRKGADQWIRGWSIPEMKGQPVETQRSLFFISQVSYKSEDELLFISKHQKHRICLEVYTWTKKKEKPGYQMASSWRRMSIDILHSKKKIFFLRYQKAAAFSDSYFTFSVYRPRWVHINVVSKLQQ